MKIIKPLDFLALFLSLGIIVFLSFQVYGKNEGQPMVYIQSDDHEWLYPLEQEMTAVIPGPLGDTIVHIHQGKADVLESPCTDKICVNAKPLYRNGEWTACLPNRVFVQIRGSGKEEEEVLDDSSF